MTKSMQRTTLAWAVLVFAACGGSAPPADSLAREQEALATDDAAACRRVTRARLTHLSRLIDGVLSLVQAERLDPRGSTDTVDAIYYNNVKLRLDSYRVRPDLVFADDAPGAVPTPATVEALPYQVGIWQQDLDTARYRTFVRSPRTSRVRLIGDQAAAIARGIEAVAQDAYDCHEGISGIAR